MAMITMNISLNKELAEVVDREVKTQKFANRSEFLRHLIRKHYFMSKPKKMPSKNLEYYKTIDHALEKDWMDDSNEDLFLIK
ncbi:MAG: ribbon-helix-helix domain-containing protein [Candidatus Gracilibacteria bacterium]|nr:ribbon-helix-helix domain-containing protein [Candidatus Gracilibacteria bacterium]